MRSVRFTSLFVAGLASSLAACSPFQVKIPSSLQQPGAQLKVEVAQKPVVDGNERGRVVMRIGQTTTASLRTSEEQRSETARATGPFPYLIKRVTHTYRYAFTVEPGKYSKGLLIECTLVHRYDSEAEDEDDDVVSTTLTNQSVTRTCEATDEQNVVASISFVDAREKHGAVGKMQHGATVYSIEPIRRASSQFQELSPGMAGSGVYGYRLVLGNQVVAATQTMMPVRLYSNVREGGGEFAAIAVFFGAANYPGYLFPNAF
jgi:hypothetical protein